LNSGFEEKSDEKKNNFFIINSCTVTAKADKDTRNAIRRFHRANPDGRIVVAGCYAELDKDRETLLKMPGVARLIRNSEKADIAGILSSPLRVKPKPVSYRAGITGFKGRNRAFIKVQDGCDYRCSYCKVSIVRGPSKSRCAEEIEGEARGLVERGFKEIVLTGVCLGTWKDNVREENSAGPCPPPWLTETGQNGAGGLAGLAKRLSRIDGKFRIRLSSIEPGHVTDRLIRVLKDEPRLCKHLHIPLQSGDDKILKLMSRPYNTKKFMRLIKKIRKQIPDIAVTTDIMLGFPGEDSKSFQRTEKFIRAVKPSRMHVFSYSKRDGTAAAKLNGYTSKAELRKRVYALIDLSERFQNDFARRFIGKPREILIESRRDRFTGLLAGYTDRYVRVLTDGPDSLKNCLISVIPKKLTEPNQTPRLKGHIT